LYRDAERIIACYYIPAVFTLHFLSSVVCGQGLKPGMVLSVTCVCPRVQNKMSPLYIEIRSRIDAVCIRRCNNGWNTCL